MESSEPTSDEVLAANISFHSALAQDYDSNQPHFRPENVARVEGIVRRLAEETGGGSLVDLGCGTGFVLNIAKRYFDRVVGVDITPDMLQRVDTTGNVEVCLANTDSVPLPDGEFDACTAYGYLHHLYDLAPTLREAARLLRPGGRFFSDQDPNQAYWAALAPLAGRPELTGFVAREVTAVTETDEVAAAQTDLSPAQVRLAEYQKMRLGGFSAADVVDLFESSGFSHAEHRYEWFLGQAVVLHDQSEKASGVVESYLRAALPVSAPLFKYVSFYATK